MDKYNKELCDERHRDIQETQEWMRKAIIGLYLLIISGLLTTIGFIVHANSG